MVTAASRGLGYSVASVLVDEGARVIICGRNQDALEAATDALGGTAHYVVADLSKREDIARLAEEVNGHFEELDGLFVNAGGPRPGRFDDVLDSDWADAFQLTVMSAVRLTKSIVPLLRKSETPSILYSTSISVKQPIDGLVLSNSLRLSVIGLMRTLARELGTIGIRINAVCPGYFSTRRVQELIGDNQKMAQEIIQAIPLGRMGEPIEFGRICSFLMSPLASYVHGAVVLIDGGIYRGMT